MLRHLRSVSAWLLSGSIAMSAVVAPQPGSAAGNAVTDVSYGKKDGTFTVSVAAAGSVSTRVKRLSVDAKQNLQDLVIDVSPASYDGQTRVIGFSSGAIRQVRFGQLSSSPAIMRIVVEAHGVPSYDLKAGNGNKSVTLSLPTSATGMYYDIGLVQSSSSPGSGRPLCLTGFRSSGAGDTPVFVYLTRPFLHQPGPNGTGLMLACNWAVTIGVLGDLDHQLHVVTSDTVGVLVRWKHL